MKTIIKIVVALLFVIAAFNGGRAAFTNYQFEDAVHEGLLFNPRAEDKDLIGMVLKNADDYGVPIDASGITVKDVGPDRHIEMTYTTSVVLVPGIYAIDWTFSPSVSTRFLPGTGAGR